MNSNFIISEIIIKFNLKKKMKFKEVRSKNIKHEFYLVKELLKIKKEFI